ncbi:MAG: peptidase M28 family protein, partial [Alphaproteobacteria bacterium]
MTIRSLFLASTLLATLSAPAIAQRALPTAVTPDPAVAAIRDKALQDDVAYDIVSGLTTEIGPRPDGSPAEERARQWALVKLKALGFQNVRVEPYELKNVWIRGVETAEVVAPFPQPLRLTALGNS